MVAGAVALRLSSMMMPCRLSSCAARLHIDGDIGGDRGEDAGLQQEGGDLVADLEFIIAEGAQGGRHQKEVQKIAAEHGAGGDAERRAGQSEIRHAGGAHDRQLAVAAQPRIDEQHDDEAGDRQDGGDEARHQQQGEFDEDQRREAVIDDDLDEAQGLREPDERDQPDGDENQRHQQLSEDVGVDPVEVQAAIHAGVLAGCGGEGKGAPGEGRGCVCNQAYSRNAADRPAGLEQDRFKGDHAPAFLLRAIYVLVPRKMRELKTIAL